MTVNSVWAPLFQPPKGIRYIFLMGGRGAGRSTVASQYALAKILNKDFFRAAFMRAVHSDIRLSLWQEFNDRAVETGAADLLHLINNEMTAKYGQNSINAVGFRVSSGNRSAKLKSLANYNTVIIEEAEEVMEEEFRTLDDSLRTVKGDITIVFCLNTPPKSHWIIRNFFDLTPADVSGFYVPSLKPERAEDSLFLYFDHKANLNNLDAHTLKRYQAYENTNPDYYHHMIRGLCPDTVRGRIYSGWQLIDEIPHEAKLVRRGLDFGWSPDPLHICDIYYYNGGYILDELIHGTHIENQQAADTILAQKEQTLVVADAAEPKSIEDIRRAGVNIVGTEKGQGSVIHGIKTVSGLKISVTRRSTNIWTAYENYHWKEDKDGNSLGVPDHYWSDPMDAARYGLVSAVGGMSPEAIEKERAVIQFEQMQYANNQKQRYGL